MANNKKDNIDDWVDVPLNTEKEVDDWVDVPTEQDFSVEPEEISQTESAIRGAAQEATFGTIDELTGFGETLLSDFTDPNAPKDLKGFLSKYQKLRDESRAAYKASEEANPKSYFGGQIAGGIGSGILTGGAGVAGKLAAGVTKAGIGQLMKEGAKSGFKYGLAQGFGKSEAEIAEGELGQLGRDIAVEGGLGLAAGGAMPLAVPLAKGAASMTKKAAKAVGGLVKKIPGYDKAVTSYNWGKLGRDLTMQEADTQMVKLSQEVIKNIKDAKGSVDFKKLKEALEQNNIVVDTMEELTATIQDLLKISQADVYKTSKASQIIPVLQELSGSDPAAKKLLDQLEKRIAKQATEAASKAEQAVIKGEKKVFDQALKSGDEIDTVTNLNRSFDDIAEIPTDTSQGTIGGVKANLKRTVVDPETGEDVVENVSKMVTGDVTPYQPTTPSMTIDPITGRQVAVTKDLGSGKITALVGEAIADSTFDASKVPVGKLDEFIAVSNNFIKLAETQGNTNDPAVQRLQKLLGDLRKKSNKVIEESGVSPEIIAGRKKYTNLSEAERLLGVDDAQSILKPVDEQLKIGTIGEKLGYEKGFKDRIERDVTEELLSDTVKPETLKEFELLREVNKLVGRTGEKTANDTVSKSGLWTQIMTKGANVAGQGRASIDKTMREVGTSITNSTPVEIQNMAVMLKMSSNKAAQKFAPMVEQAIGQDGKVRKAVLFTLYQQPAFREVIKQMANAEGVAQKAAEEYNPPSNPRSPQSSSTFNMPLESEKEEDLRDLKTTQGLSNYLKTIALLESDGEPLAKNEKSSASGMFQFIDSTWKQMTKEMGKNYSLKDRFDPKKAAEVAAYFSNKQRKQLEKKIGRSANSTDLYMSHFLGIGGASKFFDIMSRNPNEIAASVYPAAAEKNPNVYYDKQGRAKTIKQIYDSMDKKVKMAEQRVAEGKVSKFITGIDFK